MEDIDKPTSKDYLHSFTKIGLGSIPTIGATASELFVSLVAPSIEKRRQEWMTGLGEKIKEAEEQKGIDLDGLASNDQFIDVVMQATSLAIKTSEQLKIQAFKNAILNTALGEAPDKTICQIFLGVLDSFTIWHIKILDFIDDPTEWFIKADRTPPNLSMGSLHYVINTAFPELKGQDELLDLIWQDLQNVGFHRSGGLRTTMTGGGTMVPRTTPFGKAFISFISSHG